jgi:hypothetical protein
MRSVTTGLTAALLALGSVSALAAPIYLNESNITVAVGPGTTATTSNNTFNSGQTINKVIDAPSADAEEIHSQTTHIWFSGGGLELLFDFQTQYDLTTLHFWNYTAEGFDVDNIEFTFFDASNTQVGMLGINPDLGTSPGITAQDIVLAAPLNVQFVTAFLTGTNNQVDFQNIGFTANLSTDRCLTNPDDPICNPDPDPGPGPGPDPLPVPEPSTIALLMVGLLGILIARRRR